LPSTGSENGVDTGSDHLAAAQAVHELNKMPNRLIFKDDKQQYLTNGLAHLKRETPQKFDCQIIAGLL
jgi:hypothetical protein